MKLSRIDYIALNGGTGEHYDMDILTRLKASSKINGAHPKDIADAIKEIEVLNKALTICSEGNARLSYELAELKAKGIAMYAEGKTQGFAYGAEDMRKRAIEQAKYAESLLAAEAIRALPITTNLGDSSPILEGDQDERKDYCGSCGEWTGGPVICCHESQSANHKPDVTKTEAIAVRQTRKESSDEQPI